MRLKSSPLTERSHLNSEFLRETNDRHPAALSLEHSSFCSNIRLASYPCWRIQSTFAQVTSKLAEMRAGKLTFTRGDKLGLAAAAMMGVKSETVLTIVSC